MTAATGAGGRGWPPRWRSHSRAIVCTIIVGIALLWIALPSPWGSGAFGPPAQRTPLPPGGPNGTVEFDNVVAFVNSTAFPVATVWGDVHVNLTGSWSASGPTWVWQGYSGFYSVPECYPYCGNSSEAGVISWGETFCTNWPGGGTSYWPGENNLTTFVVFWAPPSVSDTVSINLTAVVSPLNVCPAY